MTAEISDKLIHVRHIFVLVSFLVYGAVNNSVCLTFNGERKIYVLENQITKEKQGVLILQSLKKYAVDTTKNNIHKPFGLTIQMAKLYLYEAKGAKATGKRLSL